MGKKTGVFTEGQLVYAKVKGYSPWPAKITKVIAKHKYGVYFYGTKETGNCKSEELDPYDERTRAKFNSERQMKKPDYKEAVDQIEEALKGNDPAPSIISSNTELINETPLDDTNISHDNDVDPDESRLQIAEDVPKPQSAQKRKAPVKKAKAISVKEEKLEVAPETPKLDSETKENDEKISRSGRKIKEKKINNDEMDPDEVFTPPRKRFRTEEQRAQKTSVSLNESEMKEFCMGKMHILQDPERKQFLMTQMEMIQLVQDIKLALGLERADVNQSLELLTTFKDKIVPNITSFMLLKYPNTVHTIQRMRNYIGNTVSWGLEEPDLSNFKEKAKLIRSSSSEIYDSFKTLFTDIPESSSFTSYFCDEQKRFADEFQKVDVADLFEAFNIEELKSFASKLTENNDAHEKTQETQPIENSDN